MSRITRFILTLALISVVAFADMFAATPPSSQARYISFSNVTSTSVDLTLVKGNGNKRVIIFSTDNLIDFPTNATTFTVADGTMGHAEAVGINGDVAVDNLVGSEWFTTISGLTAGQTYYVKVLEYNEDGSAPITAFNTGLGTNNPRSFTTAAGPVNPPTDLAANSVTATTANLSWIDGNSLPASDGFIFTLWVDQQGQGFGDGQYDENSATVSPYVELDLGYTTSLDLTDLVYPSDYKYEVSSYIGNDESASSYGYFFTPYDDETPEVIGIIFSGGTGTDGVVNEGDNNKDLTFVISFSEPMKTWLTPSFTFNPVPAGLTYSTGSWNPAGTEFTAIFAFGNTAQENLDIDVSVLETSVQDLAGNSIDEGAGTASDVFSIDNKDGVLSDFTFAGGECYSAPEEDLIQFSITLAELGYNSGSITANDNFVVVAEDQVQNNQITFTSANEGNGVYTFSTTLGNTQPSGIYNLNIQFTDGAGNVVTETHNELFTIDNTAPVISDASVSAACEKGGNSVTLTFTATDVDGCGTLDKDDIIISDNVATANAWTYATGPISNVYTYRLLLDAIDVSALGTVSINATDDAGNNATTNTDATFTIDNTPPVISAVTTTPGCNNAGDVVNISFNITDAGCGTPQDVTVTGLPAGDGVLSSANVTGTAPYHYVYTYTIGSNDAEGKYKVTVNAKDGVGNAAAPVNATNPFNIDNTAPFIQSTAYDVTCVNGEDVVTLTIAVVEEGCGTFDKSNLTISGTTGLVNVFENDFVDNWASIGNPGTGPTDLLEFGGKLYSANLYGNNISVYDGNSWATAGTYGGNYPTVLAVYNSELYAANENSNDVYKYDGTNWASVGSTGGFQPRGMAAFGANLYVSNRNSNNVSVYNGSTWSIAGTYNGTQPIGLVEFGGKLYAANAGSNNISVYDGTNWSIAGTYGGSQPTRLAVYDGQLYASNEGSNNVYVFDGNNWVSTGSNPGTSTHGLAVLGNKLYSTNWGNDKVTVYDGTSWTNTANYSGDFPRGIANYDGKLYVANLFSNDVLVYNTTEGSGTVSDPYVFTYTLDIDANDPSGPLDITIKATDDAGNAIEEEDLAAFTIDNDAPVFSDFTVTGDDGSCLKAGSTLEFTVEVVEAGCGTFNSSDVNIGITPAPTNSLVADGGNPLNGTGTYKFTLLLDAADTDGGFNLTFDGTDDVGNVATQYAPAGNEFTLDKTAPIISAASVLAACEKGGNTVTLTFDVAEAGCGTFDKNDITITDDVATTNAWTWVSGSGAGTYTYTLALVAGDPNGLVSVTINANDDAGNAATTNTDASFTIDNTAPLISGLTVSPTCNNASDEVTIEFDIAETGCGSLQDVTVTGLPTGNGTLSLPEISGSSPYHYSYTYTVGTTDVTGNYTVLVDANDGAGNSANQAGGATLSDFAVDNTAPINGGNSISTACVKEGADYNFSFQVVEIGCGTFDADNISISGLPTGNGVLSAPIINFDSEYNTYAFEYTYTIGTTTAEGSYPFTVSVTDDAGNLQANTGPSGTIKVDKTAPVISVITLDKSCVKNGEVVAVSFTVTDPTALCDMDEEYVTITGYDGLGTMGEPTISVVGGLYTYSANLTITSAAPTATLTLTANANDDAGNAATTVTADIFIDNAGPVLSNLVVTPNHAGGSTNSVNVEFDVVSNGCSTFDASSVVYTVTGPAILHNAITPVPVFVAGNTWRSTLAISNLDQSGNYHISLVAADGLGNPSNLLDPAGVELVIDNTPPQVASSSVSKVLLNRADDDGLADEFYIDVTYNEALDNTVIPTLTYNTGYNPTSPVAALTLVGSGGFTSSTTIRYTYNLDKNTDLDMRGIGIKVNGAKDVAGNLQTIENTKSNLFGIDFLAPFLQGLTVNNPVNKVITDTTTTGLELVFDFSETMTNTSAPTITFETGNGPNNATLLQILSTTAFPSISKWNLGDVYTAKYTINGTYGLEVDNVAVGMTNATDLAGNPFPGSNESEVFSVDTKEPGCGGITMNPVAPQVIVADLDFDVIVVMDQSLAAVAPTITFTNSNANYTISNEAFTDGVNLNDTYSFRVTHDGTQELLTETMSINGFTDTHGNVQAVACTTSFDVDTKLPSISSLTVSESNICGNSTGTEVITITFDEAMKTSVVPTIAFAADLTAHILHFQNGTWNTPTNTVYTANYTIDTVGSYTYTGVDISVSGAQDALGNTMATDNTAGIDKINVDSEGPNVNDITFSPNKVNRALIGPAGLSVAITYNEAMNPSSTPTIVFSAGTVNSGTVAEALTLEGGGAWTTETYTNDTYTATYTVNDAAVDITDISATITGASDLCGNVQGEETPEPKLLLIDLIAPTCSTLVADTDPIYEGDKVQTLSVMFSEEMSGLEAPTFSFANSTNFTVGTGSWNGGNTIYTVNATHNGTEEEIAVETVSLNIVTTTPTDFAGNPIEVATCSDNFVVDTKKPTVTLVEFTPSEVNGTPGSLNVKVTFSEDMSGTNFITPSIDFSATLTSLLTYNGASKTANTYTFNYSTVDANIDLDDVTVTVSNGYDVAGNIMLSHISSESFDIDQVSPTIVSLSVSDAMINKAEANNGLYRFTATATFSEAMNTSSNPSIAFSPDVTTGSPSLTLDGTPAWSNGDKTVAWTYTASDQSVAIAGIDITIAGGQDAFGNATDYTTNTGEFADKFSIDTENPTIAFDDVPQDGSCVNGTEHVYFIANDGDDDFSGISTVEARINGGTFAACTTGVALNTLSGWPGTDGALTLELKATDVAGNTTTTSIGYVKDATAPVVSAATFTNNCVTTGDTVGISFTVTEAGCGGITGSSISTSGFPQESNGTLSGYTVTGSSPTFTVTASYIVGSNDAQGMYDITFNATDGVGNTSTGSPVNIAAFTIDKTAPSYALNTPATPACTKSGATVSLVINTNDNTFGCANYGVSNISAATSSKHATVTNIGGDAYRLDFNTTSLVDSTYNVFITLTDGAGNVSYPTIYGAFRIDNTAPSITNVQVTPGCIKGGTTATLTFKVVENGCGSFTSSNITVNDNADTENSWTYLKDSLGTYTYTLLVDAGDADGAVDVTVSATDAAGNTVSNVDAGDTDFTIDNTAPAIAISNPTAGAVVNGTKVVNYTVTETGCGVNTTMVSFDNSIWGEAQLSGNTISSYSGFAGLSEGPFTLYFKSTDYAGNVGTSSVALVKDTQAPTVTSVTPSDYLLSIADGGTPFTVAVLFNDNMDATVNPTVALTANGTVTNSTTSGTWNSPTNTTFTATFGNINGASAEEIADLDVTVSGAKDNTEDIGNAMTLQTVNDVFSIDTKSPTCSGMTNNNSDIYENDKVVTVTVNFSEAMAALPLPTLNVSGTSNLVPSTGVWANTTTFTQLFTHNGNAETTSANFQVGNTPTDLAGNPVTAQCSTDVAIDTRKPLVSGVTFTPALITRATTTFSVAVAFDETMGATVPTLAFNGGVGSAFSLQGSSGWSGNTYTFNYNVSNSNNYSATGLTVDISGAKDAAGNVMLTKTSTQTYAIDQLAPTISVASIKSNNSINDQYAHVGNDIKLTITPSEKLTTFTGNIAGYSGFAVSDQFIANGTYVLTVSTDPSVSAGLVTFSIDYKDLNGNAGATLTSVTNSSSVTVDKVAPVGTIAQAGGQADPTVDSPINFALTFSENVYGLTDGDITVSGGAGATTAVVTGSGATYNVAVTGMTGSGTVVITLATGKVTDVAGNFNTTTTNTDNTVTYNVSGATTVAAGAGAEPATLSSLVDTQGEAVLNFDFAVTDDGGTPGADLLATLITDISVSQGTGNDFGNWTTILAGAELSDGTNTVTGTVGATSIAFTGLAHGAGQIGEVADNATKTYTLKVWLSSTPSGTIDNLNLAFKVNRSSFTADGSGSSFAGGAGTDIQSGATNNAIDVIATKLAFTTTPTSTEINTNTTFVIIAADANGNKDVDYGPSTVTLTPNLSTIASGGSGSLTSGTLTLNAVQFSNAFANDFVTATATGLTAGVSNNFNIKAATPAAITNLSTSATNSSIVINFVNPDNKGTLIIAKKTTSSTISYSNEAGMDNETTWSANTNYGSSQTPSDASTFVIYLGSGVNNVTMYNLTPGTKYAIAAYAFAGTINSGTQNFNENEVSLNRKTAPKGTNFSEGIAKGLSLGIDNITPQPANLNNVVSLQVETIDDMPLTLELYDSKGQKMMTLFEGKDFTAGETPFEFSLTNTLSSGQHFLRLTGNGHVVIAPLMIVK